MLVLFQSDPYTSALLAACSFLAGVVVTLGGVWFTHVKNAVSRDQLEKALSEETSPYMKRIYERLGAIAGDVETIRKTVEGLPQRVADLEHDVEGLQHKANGEARHARGHHGGGG